MRLRCSGRIYQPPTRHVSKTRQQDKSALFPSVGYILWQPLAGMPTYVSRFQPKMMATAPFSVMLLLVLGYKR